MSRQRIVRWEETKTGTECSRKLKDIFNDDHYDTGKYQEKVLIETTSSLRISINHTLYKKIVMSLLNPIRSELESYWEQ